MEKRLFIVMLVSILALSFISYFYTAYHSGHLAYQNPSLPRASRVPVQTDVRDSDVVSILTIQKEQCANGIDDDGDGNIDCQDKDCNGKMGIAGVCEFGTEMTCNDLFDNDADGPYDCSDPDCVGTASCGGAGGETVCNNLIDDDGDGFIDCEDSDCDGQVGTLEGGLLCEFGIELTCNDRFDNDADGSMDCLDIDCDGQVGTLESGLLCEYGTEVTCDDLFDNDADTFVDCSDSDCEGTPACLTAEICTNGIDDDGDGLIDCQDPDCDPHPLCGGVTTDICTGYFTGNMNKPASYPTYTSLFEQSWTFMRDIANLPVGTVLEVNGPNPEDFDSLEDAFNAAENGDTILVYSLIGNELGGFSLTNRQFDLSNPLHIYFVNPIVVTHPCCVGGASTIHINNVEGLVFDGMNNLKITAELGANPWAQMFLGSSNGNMPKFDQTVSTVFKNFEVDGMYYGPGYSGSKWGIFGEDNTDIGFCNLNVHNVWQEHAFYFHHIAGNFEVVASRMDDLGRSCIQIRADWAPAPGGANYIMADNVCTNSCEAQAFKADDPSGTWWIHGNVAAHNTQGFVSTDSSKPTQGNYWNHQDGRLYFYDNKIWMGEEPRRESWQSCDDIRQHVLIRDGGAKYFIENNVFLWTAETNNFVTKKYVSPTWSGHYESTFESFDNNIYGFGDPSHSIYYNPNEHLARWEWPSASQPSFLDISEWQEVNNNINKPLAYGINSQYVFDENQGNIQTLINTYFQGIT